VAYFILKNLILGPLLRLIFRPWVRGMENIPSSGAVILASNHLSFSDSIFLPLQSRRPVVFLAKSEYFTGKGVKGALVRWFFKSTGQLPIDRSGGKASEASLNTGLGVLSQGLVLGIYPTRRALARQTASYIAAAPASLEWRSSRRSRLFQ
jgi:1-acyl-sn-glycerol-3-phosphate acyltransferase